MPGDLVIGIDSSTTATKAIAWDAEGNAIAEGRAAITLSNPHAGWFEQEPADWWKSTSAALSELTSKIDAGRVAALSISNQRESFSQFDAAGNALRPGTLWLDSRATAEVAELTDRLGADHIHQISGKPPDVVPCLYRCAWFAKHMPDIWRSKAMTAEVHGFLTFRLTGKWHTSTASADPTGLLDLARQQWSEELLAAVGLDANGVPKLFHPGESMGEVTGEAAGVTGLRKGTKVVAGGGDGQCAGTGANVFASGRSYINMGTAVVSGNYGKSYHHHRAFRTMTAIAEEGFTYETAIRTGTFLVNWMMQQLFGLEATAASGMFSTLEAEAATIAPGADGLVLVPYWSGSMTPYWDSDARGVIAGLTSSHRRSHVYRALMEGIALEQSMITDQVAEVTTPIDHFVAIGGGAASNLWCQILADCSGRTVLTSETVEASSLGAGVAAARGAGWFPTFAEAASAMAGRLTGTFTPEPLAHERYRELLSIYADLWPAIANWNARIASFAQGGKK